MARLLVAIGVEIAYAVFTRTWLRTHIANPIGLEFMTTALRLGVAGVHWTLFRDVIRQRTRTLRPTLSPLFFLGVGVLVASPIASGLHLGTTVSEQSQRVFFSLTSLIVGPREELFYRGILQNSMEKRVALPVALLASNVLFSVYHYGAQPMTPRSVATFLVVGSLLGLVYFTTRSVLVAGFIHATYDMVSAFTVVEGTWTLALQVISLTIILLWSVRWK